MNPNASRKTVERLREFVAPGVRGRGFAGSNFPFERLIESKLLSNGGRL